MWVDALAKYNKFIMAVLGLGAVAAQAVVAAKGINITSVSAIITAVVGAFLVHWVPNLGVAPTYIAPQQTTSPTPPGS